MALSIKRSPTLPVQEDREKNCIYLVKPTGSMDFDVYLVDELGTAYTHFNERRFADLFERYNTGSQGVVVVPTIPDRDALELHQDAIVFVLDDGTTGGDPAHPSLWIYVVAAQGFIKACDCPTNGGGGQVSWTEIIGGPNVTAAAVEQAVADSHTHENKLVLDELDEDENGLVTYKETPITTYLVGDASW